jgi:hypothetical protein
MVRKMNKALRNVGMALDDGRAMPAAPAPEREAAAAEQLLCCFFQRGMPRPCTKRGLAGCVFHTTSLGTRGLCGLHCRMKLRDGTRCEAHEKAVGRKRKRAEEQPDAAEQHPAAVEQRRPAASAPPLRGLRQPQPTAKNASMAAARARRHVSKPIFYGYSDDDEATAHMSDEPLPRAFEPRSHAPLAHAPEPAEPAEPVCWLSRAAGLYGSIVHGDDADVDADSDADALQSCTLCMRRFHSVCVAQLGCYGEVCGCV